jgi:hypothetical protein
VPNAAPLRGTRRTVRLPTSRVRNRLNTSVGETRSKLASAIVSALEPYAFIDAAGKTVVIDLEADGSDVNLASDVTDEALDAITRAVTLDAFAERLTRAGTGGARPSARISLDVGKDGRLATGGARVELKE